MRLAYVCIVHVGCSDPPSDVQPRCLTPHLAVIHQVARQRTRIHRFPPLVIDQQLLLGVWISTSAGPQAQLQGFSAQRLDTADAGRQPVIAFGASRECLRAKGRDKTAASKLP